ncbi:MAG: hypothetical protein HC899_38005 [Leptolyngbyaceae cyanobacterium SM1_4_3]|nr:hypothetical protein [Leptolyngbyaceae cyanobacterium SM1_4_3]
MIGAFAGHLLANIKLMIGLSYSIYRLLTDLRKGFSGQTYSVRELFKDSLDGHEENFKDIEKYLIQLNGTRNVSFDDMVKVHVAPGSCKFVCYTNNQLFESHIIISNIPKEGDGVQKFFILHEISHIIVRMLTQSVDLALGLLPYYFYILWIPFFIQLTANSFVVLLALFVSMILWNEDRKQRLNTSRLLDEILADCMAIGYMSPGDLEKLSKNRLVPKLLNDRAMIPLHNSMRLAKLRENINYAVSGKWREGQIFEKSIIDYLPESNVRILVLSVWLLALPAYYATPSSWTKVFIFFGIDILFTLLFFGSLFIYGVFRSLLQRRLDAQFPNVSS